MTVNAEIEIKRLFTHASELSKFYWSHLRMSIIRLTSFILLSLLIATTGWSQEKVTKPQFTPLWTAEGFSQPESVYYDAKREHLYVSNVQGSPSEKDGKGYISVLSLDGKVLSQVWVRTGLNAPKGMTVVGDILYVADIDALIGIDLEQSKVTKRYDAKGAKFLNDVTADKQGNIYVSDMFDNAIWCFCKGDFTLWLRDKKLDSPNGLLAEDQRLLVASWGEQGKHLSDIKAVSYKKKITPYGQAREIGNLDGLSSDGEKGYYVTDWVMGRVLQVTEKGKAKEVLAVKVGSTDHIYIADKKLLIIPMMQDNQVQAFKKE
jgi:sugar lactone lactonase YvrE